MNARSWLLMVFLSFLWGGSFIFNRVALRDLDTLTLVMFRVVIATVALHGVLRASGLRLGLDGLNWRGWLEMSVLNNLIPFCFIVWGQTRIAPGLASILYATSPLFGVAMAHWFTRGERLTANRVGGIILGIAGVLVLIGPNAIGSEANSTWGQIAVLSAALSYALAGIRGRSLGRNPALVNATGQITCAALIMIVLAPLVDRPWVGVDVSGKTVLALLGLGLLSTAVGYLMYFHLLQSAGATNLLLVTLLMPVSALLLGWLLLSESIHRADIAGMTIIAASLLAIDGRVLPLRSTKSAAPIQP